MGGFQVPSPDAVDGIHENMASRHTEYRFQEDTQGLKDRNGADSGRIAARLTSV